MAASQAFSYHEKCRHWRYGLTCRQFDQLLDACGGICQTSARPCHREPGDRLVIDHDYSVGDWAVRGLLCQVCNSWLRYDRATPEWAAGYLADPWWPQVLRERNLPASPPEPATTRVLDFYDHLWFRRTAGWSTGHKKCRLLTWPELVRRFGPHNLTPYTQASPAAIIRGRVIG